MIDLIMQFGTDVVFIRVNGNSVSFSSSSQRDLMSTIDGLKLNYNGVIKEFPELKDNSEWRSEAIAKFKDKIKGLANEEAVTKYVLEDLRKFGYRPLYKQKIGFRKEAIK